jgi:hypothetical protein
MSQVQGSRKAIYETQTSSPHFLQRPDADYFEADSNKTSLTGHGGTFQIGKQGNSRWMFTNWYTWRSPGFDINDIGYMRSNDEIQEVFWVGYYQSTPVWIFRQINLNFNQWFGLTFGLDKRYLGGNINGFFEYKNYWSTGWGASRDGRSLSTDALRGGPSIVYDGFTEYWGNINTDSRGKIRFSLGYNGGTRDYGSDWYNNFGGSAFWQVSDAFSFSLEPAVRKRMDKIAYVDNVDEVDPIRYVRGELHQTETSMTIRFIYNITPDFTIQYYGMPFISAGEYDNFKLIADSRAENFNDRYTAFSTELTYNEANDNYQVDENNDQVSEYSFDNPDYNYLDFNSNLVVRWEYLPGSTVYLVWTQHRNRSDGRGTYSFGEDSGNLFVETYPHDVFLIKLSYRFGL